MRCSYSAKWCSKWSHAYTACAQAVPWREGIVSYKTLSACSDGFYAHQKKLSGSSKQTHAGASSKHTFEGAPRGSGGVGEHQHTSSVKYFAQSNPLGMFTCMLQVGCFAFAFISSGIKLSTAHACSNWDKKLTSTISIQLRWSTNFSTVETLQVSLPLMTFDSCAFEQRVTTLNNILSAWRIEQIAYWSN